MPITFRSTSFFTIVFLTLFMAGCSGTPTRHLVSDAVMIKAGQSSRDDVLELMGDPDSMRMVTPETEEWVYYEEDRSVMQDTPFVGGSFDPDGYNMVVLTFSGNTVASCRYSGLDDDEFDWKDDYSWQETEKE